MLLSKSKETYNKEYSWKQESYVSKAIEIKYQTISYLLIELAKTKELYKEFKDRYIAYYVKYKAKIAELTARNEHITGELNKVMRIQLTNEYKFKRYEYVYKAKAKKLSDHNNELHDRLIKMENEVAKYKIYNERLTFELTKVNEVNVSIKLELKELQKKYELYKKEYEITIDNKTKEQARQSYNIIENKTNAKNMRKKFIQMKLYYLYEKVRVNLGKIDREYH